MSSLRNSLNFSISISGTVGSSYRIILEIFNNCTAVRFVYLSNSLIFAAVISAALFPEYSIEPNVGPILASPCVSVTDIPAATNPGYTSPVLLTTCSSPR